MKPGSLTCRDVCGHALALLCAVTFAAAVCSMVGAQAPVMPAFIFGTASTLAALPASAMVLAGDGNYYGVCFGPYAPYQTSTEIYRMTPAGQSDVVATLTGPQYNGLYGPLTVGTDGALYASAEEGGDLGQGAIVRCTLSGTLTTIFNFASPGPTYPNPQLTSDGAGGFYGATRLGGESDNGEIYHFEGAGALVPVVPFQDYASAISGATGGVTVGDDGYVYAVSGALYRGNAASGLQILHNFGSYGVYSDGVPQSPPIQSQNGSLYGITDKVLYTVTAAGKYSVIVRFPDGQSGKGALVDIGGKFYGGLNGVTISRQGVYELTDSLFETTLGGAFTILHTFTGNDGQWPNDPVAGQTGYLYGSCEFGGVFGLGTLWRLGQDGRFQVIKQLYDSNGTGTFPIGGLSVDTNHNLYTVTQQGGSYDAGAVAEFDRSGTAIPRYSFTPGTVPLTAPTVNTVGELVGAATTPAPGTNPLTIAYAIDDRGNQRTLHAWVYPTVPTSGFIPSVDGSLYGTENDGVYLLSRGDLFSLVRQFDPAAYDQNAPIGGVTFGPDGALYGVEQSEGMYGAGLIYRMTTAGVVTVIHDFTGFDGGYPDTPPTLGPDGALYGTTPVGGANDLGVIYRITPLGNFRVVRSFLGTRTATPFGTLTAGTDGMLYGLCNSADGSQALLYRVDTAGNFSIVSVLPAGAGPANPVGALCQIGPDLFYADGGLPPPHEGGVGGGGGTATLGSPLIRTDQAYGAIYRVNAEIGDHDFSRTGGPDVLFQNKRTGDVTAWTMSGVQRTGGVDLTPGRAFRWQLICSADLNLDGKPDLLLWNPGSGELDYWLMDGSTRIGSGTLARGVDNSWRPVCVSDLDASDRDYLLWQNTTTGSIAWWHLDGLNVTSKGVLDTTVPNGAQLAGAADLTGSGYPDLVFQNSAAGTVTYWAMKGTSVTSEGYLAAQVGPSWRVAGLADLNGDFEPDLIWWNRENGDIAYWLLNGLKVSSTGTIGRVAPGWQPVER